jgi:hypothetical protein
MSEESVLLSYIIFCVAYVYRRLKICSKRTLEIVFKMSLKL